MNQEKIGELQLLEQNLQHLLHEKMQINERVNQIDASLKEIEKSKDDNVYKVIGNVMFSTDKKSLIAELKDESKDLTLRKESFEKEEKSLKEQLSKLQKEILGK